MSAALSLGGTGWVAGPPSGNRLRWSWPEDAVEHGRHLLPDRLLVERAPIDAQSDERAVRQFGPAAAVPSYLWTQLGDVSLSGFVPVAQQLGGSVQAVRFLYRGLPAVVNAFDGERCVAAMGVLDGQWVLLQAPAIDLLAITAVACQLQMLATLDLFAPPPLPFEVIAEIDIAATRASSFADAATRYPAAPTLSAARWSSFQDLWNAAWAEAPGAAGPDGVPNAWQELQLVLGARWEHAVFAGLGFVDGPGVARPALDRWRDLLVAARSVAYRVRDPDGRLDPSNVVCIPAGPAPDLPMLPAPAIEQGTVRLGASGAIRASWDVAWTSPEPGVIGVQARETRIVGGEPSTEVYDGRGRRPGDPPGSGFAHREEQVDSHQVAVAASARAQDGFDRVGLWGPASPLTALKIDHYPQPPPLRSATNDGTTAILTQSPPGWAPDALVTAAAGTLRVHRRVASPARFSSPVIQALPAGALLAVRLDGAAPPDPAAFAGGQITIGALKGTVTALAWPVAMISLPVGSGAVIAVSAGAQAYVSQSPTHPDLFVQVHERSAIGLPSAIQFPDPLPPSASAQQLEYRAQLAFAAQTGPLGPAVQAFRLPSAPSVPPPFTFTTLGVDFYHRTVVQLELTNPTNDLLEVWWADGEVPSADFPHKAVPGDAGVRAAEGGRMLFDTLSLPVPNKVDRIVTIGVQAVNAADGRSPFATITATLPAA